MVTLTTLIPIVTHSFFGQPSYLVISGRHYKTVPYTVIVLHVTAAELNLYVLLGYRVYTDRIERYVNGNPF